MELNLKISENAKKKLTDLSDANCAPTLPNPFAELMEETTRTHACARAEETARNIVKESALKKRVAPDVPEFCSLFAVRKELLTIICAIWSVPKTDSSKMEVVIFLSKSKFLKVSPITAS